MISAVVLTKNEENNIERCLKSLKWIDEIIVIDDYSNDFTIRKIKKTMKSVKIYKRCLDNNFAAQRNFGLSRSKGEWVLFLDADESISKFLKREILVAIKTKTIDGYFIGRRDFFMGKELKYGEMGNIKLLRLARRKSGIWNRKVHEYWNIKGNIGELNYPVLHYPHQVFAEFVDDINVYSTIHAEENKKEKKKSNLFKIIFYPSGKFVVNYFFKLGFLDGTQGLIMATMMSFHSFLAWSKVWLD